ncbi:MAG TPA: DUF2264 domain-containing protein [Vicinamibacterales bacterium]|nr:DUF2264 domain-containing protein [Vicinamibacterales bacterium]
MNRRELLQSAGAVLVTPALAAANIAAQTPAADDRGRWLALMGRLAEPVLTNLAGGTLKQRMPVEQAAGADRRAVTHLEAVGRLFAGIAPWLELSAAPGAEGETRARYLALARRGLENAVKPGSPDFLNFSGRGQPLVDAAFLAQGLLRAPRALKDGLDAATTRNLVAAFEATRATTPGFNNWLLFSATVEAGLAALGANWDATRVEYAVRQHEQWYKGDGAYGDGPSFHWDYYNSFVIHPMLLDVLAALGDKLPAAIKDIGTREQERARRYAAVQERLIAADGSFPPIGRSLAYRCGAFQALAQSALRGALPEGLSPAQVRGALTAVIRRTLEAPGTFDGDGWLRIGVCGHQPGVGESYISTGSLYLCSVAFLPLGLPPADPFWSAPPAPFTQQRAWSGQPFPIDHAMA